MNSTKSVNLNIGYGLPILALGLVLRFATDADNTWAGIHTQLAGSILIFVSLLPVLILLGILLIGALVFGVLWVLDRFSRLLWHWPWYMKRKQAKRAAKINKRLARRRGR